MKLTPVNDFQNASWWRHQMETFSALLAIRAENSPVPGEFTAQRPVTRSFDVFFDLRLNKRLSKQLWGWWFETLLYPLWRHRIVHIVTYHHHYCVHLIHFFRRSRTVWTGMFLSRQGATVCILSREYVHVLSFLSFILIILSLFKSTVNRYFSSFHKRYRGPRMSATMWESNSSNI